MSITELNNKTIFDEIEDKNLKKRIEKLITKDEKNYDKITWQYLWNLEIDKFSFFNIKEKEEKNDKKNIKIEDIFEKIEEKYYKLWINKFVDKIKERVYGIAEIIKWNKLWEYSWNLDYKILELIEKNLPEYKTWFPANLDEKKWELIKAKLIKISRILLEKDTEDCYIELTDKYTLDVNIEWINLKYYLISKEKIDEKIKECEEEKAKFEKEFKKLLAEYLFYLWD